MLKTLQGKLMLLMIALLCGLGVVFFYVEMYCFDLYQQAINQSLNKDLADTLLKRFLSSKIGWEKMPEELQRQFDQFMAINPDIELYLLDDEGRILAATSGINLQLKRVDTAPIKQFLRGNAMFPLLGDDPAHTMRQKVFTAAAIDAAQARTGFLYVVLGSQSHDALAQRLETGLIIRHGLWIIGLAMLATLTVAIGSTLFLTRWLRRLAMVMQHVERGKPLELVPHFASIEQPTDEIDKLGQAYNAMAGQINAQLDELQKTDSARRELIANVSHDLRTPLAALRGYLETLLMKETTLSESERHSYLKIAVKQSERLTVLVEELFEFTKLEAGDTRLNREPFQLAELVQDVVQKFALAARNKNIALNAHSERDVPFVNGDIAMLECVLENLIENALRHTADGGRIDISLQAQSEYVQVQVSDSGSGIPQQDLPYIFDRFYRVDKSRSEYSGGAGLGLAIAKRVIELHGGSIAVDSTQGQGACFTFRLPLIAAHQRSAVITFV